VDIDSPPASLLAAASRAPSACSHSRGNRIFHCTAPSWPECNAYSDWMRAGFGPVRRREKAGFGVGLDCTTVHGRRSEVDKPRFSVTLRGADPRTGTLRNISRPTREWRAKVIATTACRCATEPRLHKVDAMLAALTAYAPSSARSQRRGSPRRGCDRVPVAQLREP